MVNSENIENIIDSRSKKCYNRKIRYERKYKILNEKGKGLCMINKVFRL